MEWISVKEKYYPQHAPHGEFITERFIALAYERCSECYNCKNDLNVHEASVQFNNNGFSYVYSHTTKKEINVKYWMPLPQKPKE